MEEGKIFLDDTPLCRNVTIPFYSIFKAAGVCLMLLATCCQDDIVPHVLPFVKENIKHTDWRLRDASIMAFGAILEGPDPTNLKPIVEQAMPMLIELMTDKSVIVKVKERLGQSSGFEINMTPLRIEINNIIIFVYLKGHCCLDHRACMRVKQ